MTHHRSVGAAVDLGSNSVHLLVAGLERQDLEPLLDESVFLGLGDVVDATGELGPALRAATVDALVRFVASARGLRASTIAFLGTEPIRRASDTPELVADIAATTGIRLDVLTHEEEAYLTVIGVTGGRRVERDTLMIDIGGGSSEFCLVVPGEPARAHGLKLGSARLTARHVTSDPPARGAVAAMTAEAASILAAGPALAPADVVVVGGTASNLLRVVPGAGGPMLTRKRIADALAILARESLAEVAEQYVVRPARARVLPAGAAIVDALMAHYDVAAIRVSEAGMREGTILSMDRAGDAWRDRLPELALGW